jgi:hypothetical protein
LKSRLPLPLALSRRGRRRKRKADAIMFLDQMTVSVDTSVRFFCAEKPKPHIAAARSIRITERCFFIV